MGVNVMLCHARAGVKSEIHRFGGFQLQLELDRDKRNKLRIRGFAIDTDFMMCYSY